MSMNNQDDSEERFEQRLREFQPVQPRPLLVPARRAVPWRTLATAAVVLLAVGLASLHNSAVRSPSTRIGTVAGIAPVTAHAVALRPITLGQLNATLRTNEKDLDQLLNEASPHLLPHSHRGTALYELSKD